MALFMVDEKTCTRCGACVAACPARIIEQREPNPVPTPVSEAAKSCIACGHCVAICPPGAMTHLSMAPAQCPPLRRDWQLSPERAEHFLRTRRSTRTYTGQPVERELLARLIKVASYAPTGHNSQTVSWRVVHAAGDVRKLAGLVIDWMRHTINESPQVAKGMNFDRVVAAWEKGIDRVCRSAPHVIVTHGAQNDRFAPNSCPIAISYLELAAPSFGLGTCWGGYFTAAARSWAPLQEALGLPEGHICYGAILIGYPQYAYHRLPLRKEPQISWYLNNTGEGG